MSSYLYELPTTGAISFSEFCLDQTASYVVELAETTEARANLRVALKEFKRAEDSERDYLKLVKVSVPFQVSGSMPETNTGNPKVLDEYIPKLYGITACANSSDLALKAEPSMLS